MIWYLMTIASYVWRNAVILIRHQQGILNMYKKKKRSQAVEFADDTDNISELQQQHRTFRHRKLKRKMSFAAGVDGYGQSIAILTSGGDSQGMNAAIRATVRMALYADAKTFAVHWGYQGLVDGDIEEIFWDDVTGIISKGGTIIGSARCQDFRTHEGRLKAAYNLVSRGITNLVVIGGDGSLTGADLFRKEWKSLIGELQQQGKLTEEEVRDHGYLCIVGMVGSIDNDFCGTDMTIGADSALHRIVESVDAIMTTAASHQRAFVLEVMGRNCGYLALITGIGVGADWIFIPEWPLEDGWENELCDNLVKSRQRGRLLNILILAEGATDIHGNAVTANQVRDLVATRLKYDTRVTVLGHVQRGGIPSAFDRLLASRFGAEAALTVIEADEDSEACVLCLEGQAITKKPLHECVELCNNIKAAYKAKNYKKVIELRGPSFRKNLDIYLTLKHTCPPAASLDKKPYRLAVLNVGAPAAGMNAAVGAFVKTCLYHGHQVVGIKDGFDGLLRNEVHMMGWTEVEKWASMGGSNLGLSRTTPKNHLQELSERFKEHRIDGLLVIGGFEGFEGLLQLTGARKKYDEFKIPMMLIPATMSNNVPGTWHSLGADTTLNVITECCDRIRQSAGSTQDRVFVVETMGGKCGYLATIAGIAGGADTAYILEDKFTLADIKHNVQHLIGKFKQSKIKRGLILRTEHCNKNYTTDFITRIYTEEGQGVFVTRSNVLGHIQQGGTPSPFDRLCGVRHAVRAFHFFVNQIEENRDEFGLIKADKPESAVVLGHIKSQTHYTPIEQLEDHADFKNRLPLDTWWMSIRPLLRVLAHYEELYQRELDSVF